MNMDTFVALIALDPERRERFLVDPEAELAAAGLGSDAAKSLVPTLERLAKALSRTDFPPPNEPAGSG